MSDLIKREDAVEAVYEALRTPLPDYRNDFFHDSMSYAIKIVNNIPSAEPERKNGKWRHYEGQYSCEVCDAEVDDISPFCPWCGTDMRGE